jgi:hypothetical protein
MQVEATRVLMHRAPEPASLNRQFTSKGTWKMQSRLFSLLFAAVMAVAFAANSRAETITAYLAARGAGGLVEMLPDLSADRGTLEGLRGCTNGTDACEDSARFRTARAYPIQGESLILFVAGTQPVDLVRITRNGVTVLEQRNLTTPAELALGNAVGGETIVAIIERGSESLELPFTVEGGQKASEKAATGAVSSASLAISNWVYITDGTCPTGWYEVIEGSGTGGRCRSWYTDRAQRGEEIWASLYGSGWYTVGWRYYGSRRIHRVGTVNLPYGFGFRVSRDPNDDNLYTFIIAGVKEKRIPIGNRPR